MGVKTFKRGVHPHEYKEMTMDKPIELLLPKEEVAFPLVQHIGAPCQSLVKKGERVLVGQKIADTQAFVSAPIHSSVSGMVKDIRPVLISSGNKVDAIIIENDAQYEEHESIQPRKEFNNLSDEEIRKIIREAGIVGMGGAGFPTHIKLSPPAEKKIDYVIVNGAECEPFLTSDYRVMLEEPEKIVAGLKIILKLFPNAKGAIGIEDNKPKAIEKMKEFTKNEDRIEVVELKTKYPQGAEKQLINAVTGRSFTSKFLPADVGCIVQNIDTVVAIQRAVFRGRPLMRRIVTVTGTPIKDPKNFKVKIGTRFQELIDAAGGFVTEPYKIIAGGPMMGMAIYSLDMYVTKGTSAIVCLSKDEAKQYEESNCIRCGKCVEVCPNGILPLYASQSARNNNDELFMKYKGLECCECGSCSFICPANRHLLQDIRTKKRDVLAKMRSKK